MADTSPEPGRWAFRPIPPEPRSIVELIRTGTLDAELAATVWLLVEACAPLLVAGGHGEGRTTLLTALLDFLPPAVRVVELRGLDESFDWLPQASELGWPGVARRPAEGPPIRPEGTVLLAAELSDQTPGSTWGDAARLAVRAAAIGYGLAATIRGDTLEAVFAGLRAGPVHLADEELSRLGVVLVLGRPSGRRRVVAAHYVRPVARDAHGHVQRLGPAVLATWDAATDTFEHFGWGVTPELAMRVGRRAGDFELEANARSEFLNGLVARRVMDVPAVRAAIAGYRESPATAPGSSHPGRPATALH